MQRDNIKSVAIIPTELYDFRWHIIGVSLDCVELSGSNTKDLLLKLFLVTYEILVS
jgi:hypothetical protein